ncbi:hypothetical protein RHSIM_Rhsim06G0145300 [Rhododendron simsii]|uniref:PGG domain-containing protein n=1 Tax=Rhododendron simsii TaxID=118357 RepID=A0A834GUC6_RHOSS|nr:hypothetical protein RHSIM_Rhsim06G0145300 [Rhododendron simsii]
MDLDLYKATIKGDVDHFIETLLRVSADKHLSLSSVFDQTTPLANSYLHVAAKERGLVVEYLIRYGGEVSFVANNEGKSPFYLAAESGRVDLVELMLQICIHEGYYSNCEDIKGKSPVNAAIRRRNKGSEGYYEGVQSLLDKSSECVLERDGNGFLPVHTASGKGHLDILQKLLQRCPDWRELLTNEGENILHVAARNGKSNVIDYILKTPEHEKLLNERDDSGNTPLHLAAIHWNPKVVSSLTRDKRINLELVNGDGMTALDAAEERMDMRVSFRKRLTWMALKSAGAPNGKCSKVPKLITQTSLGYQQPNMENYKDRINTLLLVATLVATVTYAAGFTMPGGYNNSDSNQGMATMLNKSKFQIFVICDTIAMFSSMIVAVSLIWAQLGDLNLILTSLRLALPLLGLALSMMSLAFMAGVYLVVSKLTWLANVVLIMGIVFLSILLVLFIPLFFPDTTTFPVIRHIAYYFFCLMIVKWKPGVKNMLRVLDDSVDFTITGDVLRILWEKDQSSFNLRCDEGRNALHFSASVGFLDGVKFLLSNFCAATYQRDLCGFFPIHTASSEGHVDIIQGMLQHCPDSRELLTLQGQNIFHVAVKSGNDKAVSSMLKMPELEKLLNEKDDEGNTPLHLATICGHPRIVSDLTWDERVNLELGNKDGLTVLDIAEEYVETMASFRKRLTWMALRIAGAPRSHTNVSNTKKTSSAGQNAELENYKDKVNVVLLVATLVATVTFTAGFTVPGGYNNSDPDQGTATMLAKLKFQEFVICDTIAMYSSIIVTVTLICTQLGDLSSMHVALKLVVPLLAIALAMMSIAFMAGLYVVVSKVSWLGNIILVMGSNAVIVLAALFVPLCFLGSSNYRIFRQLSYFPFRLLLYAFGSYTKRDESEH